MPIQIPVGAYGKDRPNKQGAGSAGAVDPATGTPVTAAGWTGSQSYYSPSGYAVQAGLEAGSPGVMVATGDSPANYQGIGSAIDDDSWYLYRQGILGGAGMTEYGTQLAGGAAQGLDQAAQTAYADRAAAMGMSRAGSELGAQGVQRQDAQISALLTQAQQRTPSVAQAQLRMAQDTQARQMQAQAAASRGGNAAAAIRNAQAQASANALQTNQQAAVLRAQEEQQRQANIMAAQQYAAGSYGDRAKMGYQMQDAGIGRAQAGTATAAGAYQNIGAIGTDIARTGVSQQGAYLSPTAQGEADFRQYEREERERDWKTRMSEYAASGEIMKAGANIIGGAFGA